MKKTELVQIDTINALTDATTGIPADLAGLALPTEAAATGLLDSAVARRTEGFRIFLDSIGGMAESLENPGAQISFTGHSLGGGLASLMDMLFDRQAVTFDQPPFRQAANNDTCDRLIARLTDPSLSGLGCALEETIIQALQGFSANAGDQWRLAA